MCLFSGFLFKITFLMSKQNNDLLFHIVTLKGEASFNIGFWALHMEPLLDSFLHLHISLESVTTKMLCQRAKEWNWLGAKSGLCCGCLRRPPPNRCYKATICWAVCGLALSCRSTTCLERSPYCFRHMAFHKCCRVVQYISASNIVPCSMKSLSSTPWESQNTTSFIVPLDGDTLKF
jgi:cytochrome c oxidase assembly factor CtaG